MSTPLRFGALVSFALASACGSSTTSSGDTSPDATAQGMDSGAASGTEPGCLSEAGTPKGAGCNTLAFGAKVKPTCADAGAPAALGGTLVDGTYVLTGYAEYIHCYSALPAYRGALDLHAGVMNLAFDEDPDCRIAGERQRQTWTLRQDSPTRICGPQETCDTSGPPMGGGCWFYTATPTTVTLMNDPTAQRQLTYTRVP